jgi:hypothetical protein
VRDLVLPGPLETARASGSVTLSPVSPPLQGPDSRHSDSLVFSPGKGKHIQLKSLHFSTKLRKTRIYSKLGDYWPSPSQLIDTRSRGRTIFNFTIFTPQNLKLWEVKN